MKKIKVILDFDGTLTDEVKQAQELAEIARTMLSRDILQIPLGVVEKLYEYFKNNILDEPHKYSWEVNGLPATYAYEGAYLLNTSILQQIMGSDIRFVEIIKQKFPEDTLDPITRCSNYLFHTGTLSLRPHFLEGVREFLLWLIGKRNIEAVILSNSETRKIGKYLEFLKIGEVGTEHSMKHEMSILGDTRQYHMDSLWDRQFTHPEFGPIQVMPVDSIYSVDLRRPIYFEALCKVKDEGWDEIVVVADGFSLAGSLPLVMGLKFILKKTIHTPDWVENYVQNHPNGSVVNDLDELKMEIKKLLKK